jgi:L-Ala-D/L-Glu epimerase / N-acetyl-D-glutamate racemase
VSAPSPEGIGGLDLLREALDAVRAHGMEPVLGDGLGIELGCWMEACVARVTIRNASEFNGLLKPKVRLFTEPLQFVQGTLVIPSDYTPTIDHFVLTAYETARERFMSTATVASK